MIPCFWPLGFVTKKNLTSVRVRVFVCMCVCVFQTNVILVHLLPTDRVPCFQKFASVRETAVDVRARACPV